MWLLFFSLFYEPDDFYMNCKDLMVSENGGVSVARGWNVDHIDVENKIVRLEDGYEIEYEKCLLATGKFCFPCKLYFKFQYVFISFIYSMDVF